MTFRERLEKTAQRKNEERVKELERLASLQDEAKKYLDRPDSKNDSPSEASKTSHAAKSQPPD